MPGDVFRDILRDAFGLKTSDVPETIPLRILGLVPPMPTREAIVSAFRRRAIEVHPDLQLAYDHPALQTAAEAVGTRPEIRELVWARDVLLEMVPEPVTGEIGSLMRPRLPVTETPKVKVCRKCQREVKHYAVFGGRRACWCWDCVQAEDAKRAKERRLRRRANRHCRQCAALFTPARSDGWYCSPRCRQAAFRGRVTAKPSSLEAAVVAVTAIDDLEIPF